MLAQTTHASLNLSSAAPLGGVIVKPLSWEIQVSPKELQTAATQLGDLSLFIEKIYFHGFKASCDEAAALSFLAIPQEVQQLIKEFFDYFKRLQTFAYRIATSIPQETIRPNKLCFCQFDPTDESLNSLESEERIVSFTVPKKGGHMPLHLFVILSQTGGPPEAKAIRGALKETYPTLVVSPPLWFSEDLYADAKPYPKTAEGFDTGLERMIWSKVWIPIYEPVAEEESDAADNKTS